MLRRPACVHCDRGTHRRHELGDGDLEGLHPVHGLPRESLAAEVAPAGRVGVDRAAQVQRLDDAVGREIEDLADGLLQDGVTASLDRFTRRTCAYAPVASIAR